MSSFIFCFLAVAIIFLVVGLGKSSYGRVHGARQQCAACGWTHEKVQLCQYEQHHTAVVAQLCFDCSIKHDALPFRGNSASTVRAA